MGWKDPFGSSLWTVKQKAYLESLNLDTMFTPQIVVEGRTQCVGNQLGAVLHCIKSATRFAAPSFQVQRHELQISSSIPVFRVCSESFSFKDDMIIASFTILVQSLDGVSWGHVPSTPYSDSLEAFQTIACQTVISDLFWYCYTVFRHCLIRCFIQI
ncbi:putative protein isoform X1 [Capsicum galapagoense]